MLAARLLGRAITERRFDDLLIEKAIRLLGKRRAPRALDQSANGRAVVPDILAQSHRLPDALRESVKCT